MKFRSFVLFITVAGVAGLGLIAAAVPPKPAAKKPVAKKKTAAAKAPAAGRATSTTKATPAKRTAGTKIAASRSTTQKGARMPAPRRAPSQAAPTPERYKEIQGALAEKGYLKSEPSGVWDAESVDAMKRYQADQKQDPSGKITAASIIGLGLGPSTAATPPRTTADAQNHP